MRTISCSERITRSDLIVVGQTVTPTTDTNEMTEFQGIASVGFDGKAKSVKAIGVITTFSAIRILKGRIKDKQFILHHLRENQDSRILIPGKITIEDGGPSVVSFNLNSVFSKQEFLMFLIREQDGRYAPYDQTDPGIWAIYPLGVDDAGSIERMCKNHSPSWARFDP